MGRKHMGKGEITRYEQFLLFPQCFQKACFPGASKGVIVWEWVKDFHWGKKKNDRLGKFNMEFAMQQSLQKCLKF